MKFRILALISLMSASLVSGPALALPTRPVLAELPAFGPLINRTKPVCDQPAILEVGCMAKLWAQPNGQVVPAALPSGLNSVQLRAAYGITADSTAKVAVVAAYDHPNIKADLDKYSQTFGLPVLPTCTSAAQLSCFEKLDQRGDKRYPRANPGWALEIALDVQTVHAVCPSCRIELIESDSATVTSLLTAVDRAVTVGAKVVSMSWGGSESWSETVWDSHFNKAGVNFVAASGDSGYGAGWPAASGRVIAAGGTTLTVDPATGARLSETTWAGSGSGCSRYMPKPAWQHDTACLRRTIADVAAVADPATGAAIYTSYGPVGAGWLIVGGTSLSAPIIASMVALAGGGNQATAMNQLYGSIGTGALYDVTTGLNGNCSNYLCKAGLGYDGPTGVGVPVGLSAF